MLALAAQPGHLESQGTFTIARDRAIAKLAEFQLPRKSSWILKIVQAAVVADSDALVIKQSRDDTVFDFYPSPQLSLHGFLASLLSPEVSASPLFDHLRIALQSVGFGDGRIFRLDLNGPLTERIYWDGSNLSYDSRPGIGSQVQHIRLTVKFPESDRGRRLGFLRKASGRAADEYKEVCFYGQACPINLSFDGRLLNDGRTSLELSPGKTLEIAFLAGDLFQTDLPTFRRPNCLFKSREPNKFRAMSDRFSKHRTFFTEEKASSRETTYLARINYAYKVTAYAHKSTPFQFVSYPLGSYCCWLQDGVICHLEPILKKKSLHAAVHIFISGSGLESDISGLTLRVADDKNASRRKRVAGKALAQRLDEVVEALENHLAKPFTVHAALNRGVTVACLALTPVTHGISLPLAPVFLLLAENTSQDRQQIVNDCAKRVEKLQYFLTKIC